MKYFAWDNEKNAKLKAERGIGFEDVVFHIERGDLLDTVDHLNPSRYAGQRMFIVRREATCTSYRLSKTSTRCF